MGKIAFVFPGQGAQYVGMASDFIDADPMLKKTLTEFDLKHNTELRETMQNGPAEKLQETKYTQPAILFHSIAALRSFQKTYNISPDFVAGHSLGEFTALVANNVLDFSTAMFLVHRRGIFMIDANEEPNFGMSAVIGSDPITIKNICKEASQAGLVVAANFNTPSQTVLSGTSAGIQKATELLNNLGIKKVIPLAVGGPFHSPLIARAAVWLADELAGIDFKKSAIPVVSNVDAKPHNDPTQIKENLIKQVTSSVLWADSVDFMIKSGVDTFLEFGPQKVLSGMIKKIDRNVKTISIDSLETLENIKAELELLA
jgi:[acyl-carrier-protein] S-malonyltransferase